MFVAPRSIFDVQLMTPEQSNLLLASMEANTRRQNRDLDVRITVVIIKPIFYGLGLTCVALTGVGVVKELAGLNGKPEIYLALAIKALLGLSLLAAIATK